MMSIADTLRSGARALDRTSGSPQLDAQLLLGAVLGLSRSGLAAHGNEPVACAQAQAFAGLIERRRRGTPVAYLMGKREFWSLALRVTPDVLVPRPETELLVELALQHLPREGSASVLDLGTGSGAVALAIASERPAARIVAVEVSAPALAVAIQNSRDLGLAHIDWRLGSWFSPLRGERFDLIVANPPYVAAADPALENLAAEPALALCAGASGLDGLSAIAAGAGPHLRDGGWLMMEHGSDQAPAVAELLGRSGFAGIQTHLDFSGYPRVTWGMFHSSHQEPT